MKYVCNAHPRVREYGLMVSDAESRIISGVVNAKMGVENSGSAAGLLPQNLGHTFGR
jgi:hypothetical protein